MMIINFVLTASKKQALQIIMILLINQQHRMQLGSLLFMFPIVLEHNSTYSITLPIETEESHTPVTHIQLH